MVSSGPQRLTLTDTACSTFLLCAFCYTFLLLCVGVCRIGGTGGWSSKGCEVLNRNNSHVSCQCNHMTSFAVLMDISKREVLPKTRLFSFRQASCFLFFAVLINSSSCLISPQHGDVLPLKIVTYTTVSVSLFLLLLTLIMLCLLRRLRSNLHAIHRNLVAALFFSELVFLLGINQTDNVVRAFLTSAKKMHEPRRYFAAYLRHIPTVYVRGLRPHCHVR